MIKTILFWLKNARPYTIPITTLSWLVIFVYSLKHGGNILFGLISWLGISLVHLATNLSDDYFDYKKIIKGVNYAGGARDSKCSYLKTGQARIKDLRNAIITMLGIASICGIILFFASGPYVAIFALCALPIAIFYSQLSSNGLGDFAVILAYGPLMFEGVYYVMTGNISFNVLILSFACAMFVNSVLYTHMLMDYSQDCEAGKITLCTKLKSKLYALNFLMLFYITGYILIGLLSIRTHNNYYLFTFITMPFVYDLYNSLKMYNADNNSIPDQFGFWNKEIENAPFFMRFIYARNISTMFMLITTFAIIFG